MLGAILQGFVMLVWILVTGYVIININKDIMKIISFCLGAVIGSYLGSIIEEKIALGNIKLNIKTEKKKELFNILKSYQANYDNQQITIIIPRKLTTKIINIIRATDKKANIIGEKIKVYDK